MTEINETEFTAISETRSENNKNKRDALQMPEPVRKIGYTRRSVSGVYPFRGEKSIPFESTLERDFLVRKEFSRFVLEIIPQPVRIQFVAQNGRTYHYTPDFLVYYRAENLQWVDGMSPLLVEVKPRYELRKRWVDLKPKFKAALRYALEQGWDFRIHDETRIRDQVFQNIQFLKRYKRMIFPAEETRWILDYLAKVGQAPFQHILDGQFFGLRDRAVGVSHIWHLVATGQLECDMTTPLANDTVLWRPRYEWYVS